MEETPRDNESDRKLMQLKKDRLLGHLPFLQKMINKLEKPELQVRWKMAYDGILSDKKLFSIDQINKLDSTVTRLMQQQRERQLKKTVELEEEPLFVPKPKELWKPVLSDIEVQELIEDLGGSPQPTAQSPEPTTAQKSPPIDEKSAEKLSVFKEKFNKNKIMIRRSSFAPAKIAKKRPDSFPDTLIAQSSLKVPFKIPKVSASPGASSKVVEKAAPILLKSFDMFKSLKAATKEPARRWSTVGNKNEHKINPVSPTIDKIRIVKSPSSAKSHEIVKLVKSEPDFGSSSSIEASLIDISCSEKMNEDKKPNSKEEEEETDDIDESLNRLFSDTSETDKPTPDLKKRKSTTKVSKELRRLQENIVKDDSPLPSRRSCALKRASLGLEDEDEKPLSKRSRHSLGATEKEKPTSEAEKTSPKSRSRIIFGTRRKQNVEEKTIIVPKRVPVEQPSTGRSTRRSAAAAAVVKNDEESARRKQTRHSESSAEGLTKEFALKTCSVKLRDAVKSPESKSNKSPMTPTRQVAMKSTNQRQELAQKSSEAEKSVKEQEKKVELPKAKTIIYKNINNIGYTKCRKGVIRKCLLRDCRFQHLEKHMFVKHLTVRHSVVRWNGYCNICLKVVMRDKDGLTLFNEFLHMEEHLYGEHSSVGEEKSPEPGEIVEEKSKKPEVGSLRQPEVGSLRKPEVGSSKKPEVNSAKETDPELVKGLDSLLDILGTNEKPAVPQKMIIAEEVDFSKKPRPDFATTQPAPIPTSVAPQTKMISANIIGKVIPISQLTGLKIQMPANAVKLNLPANTIKIPVAPKPVKPVQRFEPLSNFTAMQNSKPDTIVVNHSRPPFVVKRRPTIVDPESMALAMQNLSGYQKTNTAALPQKPNDPMRFEEVLRPWLGVTSKKNEEAVKKLTARTALAATYKCMGKNCTFFTTDAELFELHLTYHFRFSGTDKLFQGCCYCRYEAPNHTELLKHINDEHGCDSFQCAYCFYRSYVDFNVITHQDSYHVMKPRLIIKLNNRKEKDFNVELEKAKKSRIATVLPISCICRKAQFFIFKAFMNHIKEHATSLNTTCTKCRQKTTASTIHTHLVQCHGYGLIQCVYCRFGTNVRKTISQHIANEHPSMMPFFCERIERNLIEDLNNGTLTTRSNDVSLIESTCLQRIKHSVMPQCFVNAPTDEIVMRNYSNIGDLGQSVRVQGIIGRQMPKITLPIPAHLPAGTKIQIHPNTLETTVIAANPTPKPTLPVVRRRSPQIKVVTDWPIKTRPIYEPLQPTLRLRPTSELQEPTRNKALPDILVAAPKTTQIIREQPKVVPADPKPAPRAAQPAKKRSIFTKQPDPKKLKALKEELWPNLLEPRRKMPNLTPIAQRTSLTAGAPRQLLKGSLAHQRSSLPASTSSLTAGEILKNDEGPSTQFIKEEKEDEPEESFGIQIKNVYSLKNSLKNPERLFSSSLNDDDSPDFGDMAWDSSDIAAPNI